MPSYKRLYQSEYEPDSAFLLVDGAVHFYISTADKYSLNGKNLIFGATEIIMKHMHSTDVKRVETAVCDSISQIKKIPAEKFISGLENPSFSLNAARVLARNVSLTNRIINTNMRSLSGDEDRVKELSLKYYSIILRLRQEYAKRKLPWIKKILNEYETSLTFKKGEAYFKSSEPTVINTASQSGQKDMEFSAGSIICEEQTAGEEMFILKSGIIDVYISGKRVTSIRDPGTVIGEMALLLGEKRSATLKALSGVVATRVRKEDIRDFSENEGASLFSGIASALARRHYYNVIKIGNINRSIIEHAVDSSEEGTSRIPASHRAMKDLGSLKSKLDDAVSAKKADFLSDLQSI